MSVLAAVMSGLSLILSMNFLPLVAHGDGPVTACLYPSPHERYGVAVNSQERIEWYDVNSFPAGSYLNWLAIPDATHPNGMHYYPTVRTRPYGYSPSGAELEEAVRANPGMTWFIGNEADTIWQDFLQPERYADMYHEITGIISQIDPSARFASTSLATVSDLRLEWLDRAWAAYRARYGVDMPVDVWTIHTYVVNEMVNEWGAEIPPGIDHAIAYHGDWTEEQDWPGASGDSVHGSQTPGDRAYFVFVRREVTIYLGVGPDGGIADVYLDRTGPVETIDLYAPLPGIISRTYLNVPPQSDWRQGNKHNIRVDVSGNKNPASSGFRVRVDAVTARSTSALPGGRLENDYPLRARIVTDVANYDNLDLIEEQIRAFRRWMAQHGQRNKPLVNTEYGVLMTTDLGFDYARVRDFMLDSFERFTSDLIDPTLGYPGDDNRLLQQWFWYALAQDEFEGRSTETGLYSQVTRQIKPLGVDFAALVAPLVDQYIDLEASALRLTPVWTLFAGQPSLVQVEGRLWNRGNLASGPFTARLLANGAPIREWPLQSLAKRYSPGYDFRPTYDWRPVITGDQTISLAADVLGQVADPCAANNTATVHLQAPLVTDLALANLTQSPRLVPALAPGSTATVTLQVDLLNLGSIGTAADELTVNFWNGDPQAGGARVFTQTLTPANAVLPVSISFDWGGLTPDLYEVYAEVEAVADDVDLANNRQRLDVFVPAMNLFLPITLRPGEESIARAVLDRQEHGFAGR